MLKVLKYLAVFSTFFQFALRYVFPIKLAAWLYRSIRALFEKDREQQVLEVGLAAETAALRQFSQLPDQYHIFTNLKIPYQNKSSELDIVVLGPTGIFIVEVKGYKGRLMGHWSDNNLAHQKGNYPAINEYNPTKQVGTHIYRLSGFLRSHGHNPWIKSCVFFTDPDFSLEVRGSLTDDCCIFTHETRNSLLYHIQSGKNCLSTETIKQIAQLLDDLIDQT